MKPFQRCRASYIKVSQILGHSRLDGLSELGQKVAKTGFLIQQAKALKHVCQRKYFQDMENEKPANSAKEQVFSFIGYCKISKETLNITMFCRSIIYYKIFLFCLYHLKQALPFLNKTTVSKRELVNFFANIFLFVYSKTLNIFARINRKFSVATL